jgi:DNA-binding protein H-NS
MDKEQNVASAPDWSEYTIPELQGFISEIDSEIAHQIEGKKRELREKIERMVSDEGLSLNDVFGRRRQTKAGGKKLDKKTAPSPAVKYRHPETGASWSGRGRKPGWLVEQVEAGKSLSDFAV